MQDIDDNMDDLFRKAADEYPLNTHVPDWNRFTGTMAQSADKPGDAAVPASGSRKYRRYLWLLMLLPVVFVSDYIYDRSESSKTTTAIDTEVSADAIVGSGSSDKTQKQLSSIPSKVTGNKSADEDVQASATLTDAEKKSAVDNYSKDKLIPGNLPASELSSAQRLSTQRLSTQPSSTRPLSTQPPSTRLQSSQRLSTKKGSAERLLTQTRSDKNSSNNAKLDSGNIQSSRLNNAAGYGSLNNERLFEKPNKVNKRLRNKHGLSQVSFVSNEIPENSPQSFDKFGYVSNTDQPKITAPATLNDSSLQAVASSVKPPLTSKSREKKFYIGVTGGLDLSTVEFQKFSKAGGHYGGVAGYQFAKKWSAEVGFFVDKKYYYTSGEYFDKGGLNLGSTSEVLWVDGNCLMYEIPVSIKYDIRNSYKSTWFVTGGFTSYFMKNEKYDMLYLYTNSGSTAIHTYQYKTPPKTFSPS